MVDRRHAAAFITLGCKVNQYDSEAMAEALRRDGWLVVDDPTDIPAGYAGFIVINSCTVTGRAAAKSRQAARAAMRRHPNARVIFAGCHPQVYRQESAAIQGLAGLAGTGRTATLNLLAALASAGIAGLSSTDIPLQCAEETSPQAATPLSLLQPQRACMDFAPEFETLPAAPVHGRVRAFLKVQEGCSLRCAYCIVPDTRGPQRSAPLPEAVSAAASLLEQGACEIVLTGIHLGAYGADREDGKGLPGLIRRLLDLPGIQRLRLSSIEPTDVSDELLEVLAADPRVCRHLHIPLQSGSDSVLRRMGRQYGAAEFLSMVERARRTLPGLAVSTDVLAGLPGETPADVLATERLLRQVGVMRLHVFPYSPRPGTPAATMGGQVPARVREERAHALAAVGRELAATYNARLHGRECEVLLERPPDVFPPERQPGAGGQMVFRNEGLTSDYVRVVTRSAVPEPAGQIVRVGVDSTDASGAQGRVLGFGAVSG